MNTQQNTTSKTRPADSRSIRDKSIRSYLALLGPGMITAALVFGPSKVTIASKLGADFGFDLLWIIAVAIYFMAVFTAMAARIGMASESSFLSLIRSKWGQPASIAAGIGVFMVSASFQAGNSIGIGIAIGELFQIPSWPSILVFNGIGISLLFFRSFYPKLERIMIALIIIMLTAFAATLVLSAPPIGSIASGLVPEIPIGSFNLVIAFTASCFSVVGACYQSYLVQERKRLRPGSKQTGRDSLPGILILGFMSAIVLICAASVLHPAGQKVNSASDMARILEPLLGGNASVFFLIGLFGAAFSSLIGNASLGGTLMGDALGFGSSVHSPKVRSLIALVMVIGAAVAIIFGGLPIRLMIFAQSITVLIVPFIGIALFLIAEDRNIMKDLKNSLHFRIAAILGLLILTGMAIKNVITLLS